MYKYIYTRIHTHVRRSTHTHVNNSAASDERTLCNTRFHGRFMARSVVLMRNLGHCCLCVHVFACAFAQCKIFPSSSPITIARRVNALSSLSTLQ